jgi:hypothetical protein
MALRGFVKCLADGHHCANIMLADGFCERWPKAWRGGFALVLGQLLIMAKNLPLMHQMLLSVGRFEKLKCQYEKQED